MQPLHGKTAVVTGANTGIGRVTAQELARMGARVVLACRSEDRTRPVVDEIAAAGGQAEFLALDLADLTKRPRRGEGAARATLDDRHPRQQRGPRGGARAPRRTASSSRSARTTSGRTSSRGCCCPRSSARPRARVVNVASTGHYRAPGIDWEAVRRPTRTTTAFPEYCVSKLANVLFSSELAQHVPASVHTYSLHPGAVASDVWREVPWGLRHIMKLFMLSNEDGAKTSLHCATSEAAVAETGLYYDKCRVKKASRWPWTRRSRRSSGSAARGGSGL